MATTTFQPTITLTVRTEDAESHYTIDEHGEVLEAVTHVETAEQGRVPDWSEADICGPGDHGQEGYDALRKALITTETYVRAAGIEIEKLPV